MLLGLVKHQHLGKGGSMDWMGKGEGGGGGKGLGTKRAGDKAECQMVPTWT